MNKLDIVKIAARFVVGSGTTTVTSAIIRNNVGFDDLNRYNKVCVAGAAGIIGMMAANATKEATSDFIDDLAKPFVKTPDPSTSADDTVHTITDLD